MPYWLHKFTFISALYKGSLYSTSSLTLASSLFDSSHPNRFEVFFIFKSSLKRKSIGLCGSFIFQISTCTEFSSVAHLDKIYNIKILRKKNWPAREHRSQIIEHRTQNIEHRSVESQGSMTFEFLIVAGKHYRCKNHISI